MQVIKKLLSWLSEYFKHISRHSGNIKVGVKQKKKAIKKTKLMCFVRKKGWSKYAKQNKSFKLEFSKKNELGNLCYFLTIGVVKNGRLSAEAIFAQEKIILLYLKKPRWYRLLLD